MAATELFSALLQHNTAKGYKANVLNPLIWLIGTMTLMFLGALKLSAPTWILITGVILFVLIFGLFAFAYCYCLIKNPDALRSEKYSIQKIALEKGYIGDSIKGMVKNELLVESREIASSLIESNSSEEQ